MKSNELRIGNTTFEYNQDDNDWIVSNVSCWDFEKSRLNNNENEFKDRKPIPLTEEWLLKFGFTNDFYDWELGTFCLSVLPDGLYFLSLSDDLKIEYVHQLQNIYFIINGKELTLNQ